MRKEHLNPFLKAAETITETFFGLGITKSEYYLEKTLSMDRDVIIAIAIKGDLQGLVLFGFTKEDAKKFASHVLQGQGLDGYDEWGEMSQSVMKEFGNVVVGYVTEIYGNMKMDCDITTPKLIPSSHLSNYIKECVRFEIKNDLGTMKVKLYIEKK